MEAEKSAILETQKPSGNFCLQKIRYFRSEL